MAQYPAPTPKIHRYSFTKSPIASKQKKVFSKKRSIVASLSSTSKRIQTEKAKKQKKSLFSKADWTQSDIFRKSKKKKNDNAEIQSNIDDIKNAVWTSVHSELDGFIFMKYAPKIHRDYFRNKPFVLPPIAKNKTYTLVLDLDETLVHCSVEKALNCDLIFPVIFNGETYKVFMKKRPFFETFLKTVQKEMNFEVVVFTASQQCYADKLLNLLDVKRDLIDHRLFRTHCIQVQGNFVKDLRVLGRDLSKTIIIDNSPPAFTNQVDNGIPITSWYQNANDNELMKMLPILKKMQTISDVRPAINKMFELKKLLKTVCH